MPSAIKAIVCPAMGAADDAPIGPSTSPKRASTKSKRLVNEQGFIGLFMSQPREHGYLFIGK